jgi:hypothetical protein
LLGFPTELNLELVEYHSPKDQPKVKSPDYLVVYGEDVQSLWCKEIGILKRTDQVTWKFDSRNQSDKPARCGQASEAYAIDDVPPLIPEVETVHNFVRRDLSSEDDMEIRAEKR